MMLLQKIEFWLFSVPALVVATGGVAHYGTWRALWVFPVCFLLSSALRFGRSLPVELLDGPRTRACRSGNWPRAYALLLPVALYDWFVTAFLIDLIGMLIVWRFHGAMPGWLVALCVYAGIFAVPSLVRAVQGRCDGGYGEILIEAERLMLLVAIPLAVYVELTPLRFALYTLPFGIVGLVWLAILWYKSEHVLFNSIWEGEKSGRPWQQTGERHWFMRPGVVYEPGRTPSGIITERVSASELRKAKDAITVLSISPVAFVSLALFVAGAAVLVDCGRGLVLFAGLAALVLACIQSALIEHEKWGRWSMLPANSAPYLFCNLCLGALIVWLGGNRRVELLATAAFLVGCFEFPVRHVLRASSDRPPDWWRFVCTLLAVGIVLSLRIFLGRSCFVCAVLATCASYPYALTRQIWPPKRLAQPGGGHTGQPGAVSGDQDKMDRRERKRRRQMEAFRRSRRG